MPVVENAQNAETELNAPQSLQDAMKGVEFAPGKDVREDLPLSSIEAVSTAVPNPEDDDLINAPQATSSARPSRTSSVGLGLANSSIAREKSMELRREVERNLQTYKSPFGPPAAVAATQRSVPPHDTLPGQPAILPSMTQQPRYSPRSTRNAHPSMTQTSPQNSTHGPSHPQPSLGSSRNPIPTTGFPPPAVTASNGDEGSFIASLASVVDNTIRQISAEVQPDVSTQSELPISSQTPENHMNAGRAGNVIAGNPQSILPSESVTNNSIAAPASLAIGPMALIPTQNLSANVEGIQSALESNTEPVTKVKRARGRPRKNPSTTAGKGTGKGQPAVPAMSEQANSVLPSIENGESAETLQDQQQSHGLKPPNGELKLATAPPARVSQSIQSSEPMLSSTNNRESATSKQASTKIPSSEVDFTVEDTQTNPAKTKRAYNRRKKDDTKATTPPINSTRASSKQKTPAHDEDGAAKSTAPPKSTRAALGRKSPADDQHLAAQPTAPSRATRASKRNAPGEAVESDRIEPSVEEPRKKRKYTRKQVAAAPDEREINAPEQQPVADAGGIGEEKLTASEQPVLEAGGMEGVAFNPIPTPERPTVVAEGTPSHSLFQLENKIGGPSVEMVRQQKTAEAFASEIDLPTERLVMPVDVRSSDLDRVLDQGVIVGEQPDEEEHSNGVADGVAATLDEEETPVAGAIEEPASILPAALDDDSDPVIESLPKRKRAARSVEINLEEPLSKRAALTEDRSETGDVVDRPKPPKRAYNTKKKAAAAEAAARAAAADQAFSIACTFKGEDGHLVLTAKHTLLEFFANTQHPPEIEPRYSLLIADLTKRPITSARKSNPMCIRLKGRTDTRGSDFAFAVAQTDDGYTAMHEMRSRIVAASLQSEEQPNPEAGINARLYQCEKCGLTFKNPNGKEYHLEKSQSICNPNFDPSKATSRKRGGRKKGVATKTKKADLDFDSEGGEDGDFELDLGPDVTPDIGQEVDDLAESSLGRPVKATRAAKVKTPRKKPARAYDGDTSPESEDSIYAWAEATSKGKTATGGTRRTTSREASTAEARPRHKASSDAKVTKPESRKSARRYKNLQGEAPFLAAVAQELANQEQSSVDVLHGDVMPPKADTQLTTEVCENLIVDLVVENGGLFPGDKSMWFAFVAKWWKDFKASKILPESKKCSYVLDDLVEIGRLRKLEFSFRDKKSRDIIRAIYVSPDYDENDESFLLMKESIKAAHPIFFVPDGFRPPQHVLEPLEQLVTRPATTRKPKPTEAEIEIETSEEPEVMYDPLDEDEYQREVSGSLDDEDFLDMNIVDSIEEDIYTGDSSNATKNAKIAASIRKWHEKRKALGLKAKPRKPRVQPNGVGGPPVKRGLTKEEREKLYLEEASSPCWGAAALAFMPNPATGAWDSKPVRVKGISTAVTSKPRGLGSGFAEPITYLQSEDGAWNHRAYGHGVKPIYSRPSKLVAGNPSQAAYLAKIQSGFRPIVYPTKNRIHGPAPLTKMRAAAVQKPKGGRSANKPSPISQEIDPNDPSFTPFDGDSGSDFEATKRRNVYKDLVPDSASRPKRRGVPKSTKTPTPASGIDEVEVLNFMEPKKLPFGSTQNPGLSTLPPTFNTLKTMATPSDQVWGTGSQVSFFNPQIVVDDSDFKDGSWVSNKKGPRKRTYQRIRFDEQSAFTLNTLPYEQLDDTSEGEDEEEQPPLKRLRFSVPKSVEPEPDQAKGNAKATRVKKLQPTRPQVALAVDFDGLTEDPAAFAKYVGVQMVPIKDGDQVRKRLRIGNRMTRSEEKRFVVSVIVIRVITGGIDQYIDWVLVATLFPEFSINYLSKNWSAISKKKQDLIDELVVDFQEAFLVGYRDGKIKPINFNDLLSYDWARLVRWTIKNVDTSLTRTAVQLPADREDLNEDYIATEVSNENGEAQKMYFNLICPIYRRLDAVAARQMTVPPKPTKAPGDNDIDDLMKAKSFARASALTPIETWDFHSAKEKLTQLSDDVLEAAIDCLKEDKVIIKRNKARSTTGRIYEASDAFAAPLRKPIKSEIYLQAYRYKQFLDASFRSGTESVRVDYFGDEGSYMCVTSLMASGRLRVTGLNIPIAPMGLGDDAHPYDTKRIPKAKMRWDIEMSPSPTYIYNEDNETLQNITEVEAPSSRSGAVPAWNGIHDMVIPNLWKRILCALVSTVALRSGMSKKMIRLTFKPTLEEWEIGLFMKWAEEVGLVEALDEDESVDGWMAGEWFWLCLGRMVEYLEEMEQIQKREYEERAADADVGKGKGKARRVDDDDYDE